MHNTDASVAIAVHPVKEIYWRQPAKQQMQAHLDDPRFGPASLGLGISPPNESATYSLYVNPRNTVYSPPPATIDVIISRRFKVIEPYCYLPYVMTAKRIELTLMGGEVSPVGISGCLFQAYSDIVEWFQSSNHGTLETPNSMTIMIPFSATFSSQGDPLTPLNAGVLHAFTKQFSRHDIWESSITNERAIYTFRR